MLVDTAAVYIQAFETITGQTFEIDENDEPVLERVRRNLAQFF